MTVTLTQSIPEFESIQIIHQKSKIVIRKGKIEDMLFLTDLWYYQRCHHEQWDKLYETTDDGQKEWAEYIASCFGQSNHLILVAEDKDGSILGYIHGSIYSWPYSPFEVYGSLNTISISPEAQGNGIGKKLTKKLLNWFKEEKVKHISVHVDHRNQKALALYEKVGFRSYQYRLMLDLNPKSS